jgi:hypothetical protein
VRGIPKEVVARHFVVGEILGERSVTLQYVAGPTRGHYVARRAVSSAQTWLHVIERQGGRGMHLAAVHASKSVPRENLVTRHG